jgi:proline dehydrogenase
MLHEVVVAGLPLVPRPLMWRMASRYVAGEHLEDALTMLRALAARGHPGILDILGEDVEDEAAARAVVATYRRASEAVAADGLDAYVSAKPTHVGLRLSEPLALELYGELARETAQRGQFLRVEMEDHTTTDATLRIFEALRSEHDNVGIVLQSRLLRTPDDIERLLAGGAEGLNVRMVKGIYLEPAEIAHTEPAPIRDAFVAQCRTLLERGAYVSFATHDGPMAEQLLADVRALGLGPDRYEFQVLLGVQRHLWDLWRDAGHPVRVYVPYGPEWRAYSQRRLRKNPEILKHVMRAALPW